MRLVPALRFPEFTDEWKRCTLEDCADFLDGLRKPIKSEDRKCEKGLYPYYGASGIIDYIDEYIFDGEYVLLSEDGANILDRNYRVAFIARGKIWVNNHAHVLLPYKNVDINFLSEALERLNYAIYNTGTTMPKLNQEVCRKICLNVPSREEQNRIGNLLFLLNERIATQNKIIGDLKELKSALVEMLFCKQGGILLKLGDIGSFIRGLTYSSEDVTEDINATTVIRANNLNYGNNVNKEDVVYVSKKPTEIQILRKGDIVICMANGSSSLVGKNSYCSFDDRQSTIGAFCGIYRTSQPLVKWLMQSQRYKRLVYQSLQGGNGAIANLNGDDILNMTFRVVEDEKCVSVLSTLGLIEDSIAVNESLKELYSIQKMYLLQYLFI